MNIFECINKYVQLWFLSGAMELPYNGATLPNLYDFQLETHRKSIEDKNQINTHSFDENIMTI